MTQPEFPSPFWKRLRWPGRLSRRSVWEFLVIGPWVIALGLMVGGAGWSLVWTLLTDLTGIGQ